MGNVGVDEAIKIVSEGDNFYLEGLSIIADVPNGNNRIYPKKYLKNAIDLYYKEFISQRKSIGEMDHPIPQRTMPILERQALMVEELEMDSSGIVTGRSRVLKYSEFGVKLQNVIKDGTKFGMSFRALTELNKGKNGVAYAGPEILLKAFDAVLKPSVGKDVKIAQESIMEDVWCTDDYCNVLRPLEESLKMGEYKCKSNGIWELNDNGDLILIKEDSVKTIDYQRIANFLKNTK
jgi:hypothetical protein